MRSVKSGLALTYRESRWLLKSSKKAPENIMAVYCLREQMAIFLANESLELARVKIIFPPCLLCMNLCLSEGLGGKGLLSRE